VERSRRKSKAFHREERKESAAEFAKKSTEDGSERAT